MTDEKNEGLDSSALLIGVSSFTIAIIATLFITSGIKWVLISISFIGWIFLSHSVFKKNMENHKLSNKVLNPLFPFLAVILMGLSSTYSTTNYPPLKEKLFLLLIITSVYFFIFLFSLLISLIKMKASVYEIKPETIQRGNRTNFFFVFTGTVALICVLLYSIYRQTDFGDIFYFLLMIAASFGMFIRYNRRIKEIDEIKKQIAQEVYAKTYSLLLPLLMIIGFVILRIAGEHEKARFVTLIFVVTIFLENSVKYFVQKKYEYEEE